MSTYIKNNHHNNISQYLSTCEIPQGFSIGKMIVVAKIWANRSRQRKQLALLNAHLLADIGITVEQARAEVAKPFWK